jgi:hypothetical protein
MSKFKKAVFVFVFICGVSYANPYAALLGTVDTPYTQEILAVGCGHVFGPCQS